MHPFTEKQKKSFEIGKDLINHYITISKEHQDPTVNMSTIVGDLVADLKYTMTRCYAYPLGDIEAVEQAATDGLDFDRTK
jgi:hypothetical protein